MAKGVRSPGEFCWINILSPEPAAAREFFSKVLGWSFEEKPGMGHGIRIDGKDFGAIFDVVAPGRPTSQPELGVMVKVANIDDVCAKVEQLGGKKKESMDLGRLRIAMCADPTGAAFDLFETVGTNGAKGAEVDTSLPGAPSWFETITTDAAQATAFYSALFGWKGNVMTSPGMEYTQFTLGGEGVAGLLAQPPHMNGMPSEWGVYFTVNSVDDTAKLARSLGAVITVEPKDIPGTGRFAGIRSPQGVHFYVITYAPRV